MREITTHRDGFGLTDKVRIEADEPGPGGASHRYVVSVNIGEGGDAWMELCDIQFQRGPRNEKGSTTGLLTNVLLAIVRDHLEGFPVQP